MWDPNLIGEFQVWMSKSFVELTEVVNTYVREVSSDGSKNPVCCVYVFVNVLVKTELVVDYKS